MQAEVDTHIAGRGVTATNTLQEQAVMFRTPLGLSSNGKKAVPHRTCIKYEIASLLMHD